MPMSSKRVNAAYPNGVRLLGRGHRQHGRYDFARASTTRSTQPEERRSPNARNAPSREEERRPCEDIAFLLQRAVGGDRRGGVEPEGGGRGRRRKREPSLGNA